MWSFTWQWKSHVPGSSGTMSAIFKLIGSNSATSVRMPLISTVLPCQCGVCRSTSVPWPITYQRTRWPTRIVRPGRFPYE
jgi:hypothetical protein